MRGSTFAGSYDRARRERRARTKGLAEGGLQDLALEGSSRHRRNIAATEFPESRDHGENRGH